jgi:DNA-directed RNA polymerase subunit RPC12/RpoP
MMIREQIEDKLRQRLNPCSSKLLMKAIVTMYRPVLKAI